MARVKLSPEEEALIAKHREEKRHFTAGWNAALMAASEFFDSALGGELTANEIHAKIEELKK